MSELGTPDETTSNAGPDEAAHEEGEVSPSVLKKSALAPGAAQRAAVLRNMKTTTQAGEALSAKAAKLAGFAMEDDQYTQNITRALAFNAWELDDASEESLPVSKFTDQNVFGAAMHSAAVNTMNFDQLIKVTGDSGGGDDVRADLVFKPGIALNAYEQRVTPVKIERYDAFATPVGVAKDSQDAVSVVIRLSHEVVGSEKGRHANYVQASGAADGSKVDLLGALCETMGCPNVFIRGVSIAGDPSSNPFREGQVAVDPKQIDRLLREAVFIKAQMGENHMPLLLNMAHHIRVATQVKMLRRATKGEVRVEHFGLHPISTRVKYIDPESLMADKYSKSCIPVCAYGLPKFASAILAYLVSPVQMTERVVVTRGGSIVPTSQRFVLDVPDGATHSVTPGYKLVVLRTQEVERDENFRNDYTDDITDPDVLFQSAEAYCQRMCLLPQFYDAIQAVNKVMSVAELSNDSFNEHSLLEIKGGEPRHVLDWTPFALKDEADAVAGFTPPSFTSGKFELVIGGAVLAYRDMTLFANMVAAMGGWEDSLQVMGGMEQGAANISALISGAPHTLRKRWAGWLAHWHKGSLGRDLLFWDLLNAVSGTEALHDMGKWNHLAGPLALGCQPFKATYSGNLPTKAFTFPTVTQILSKGHELAEEFLVAATVFGLDKLSSDADAVGGRCMPNQFELRVRTLVYSKNNWQTDAARYMAGRQCEITIDNSRHASGCRRYGPLVPGGGSWISSMLTSGRAAQEHQLVHGGFTATSSMAGGASASTTRPSIAVLGTSTKASAPKQGRSKKFGVREVKELAKGGSSEEEVELRELAIAHKKDERKPKLSEDFGGGLFGDARTKVKKGAPRLPKGGSVVEFELHGMDTVGNIEAKVAEGKRLDIVVPVNGTLDDYNPNQPAKVATRGLVFSNMIYQLYNKLVVGEDDGLSPEQYSENAQNHYHCDAQRNSVYLNIMHTNGLQATIAALMAKDLSAYGTARETMRLVAAAIDLVPDAWGFVLIKEGDWGDAFVPDYDTKKIRWKVYNVFHGATSYKMDPFPELVIGPDEVEREIAIPMKIRPQMDIKGNDSRDVWDAGKNPSWRRAIIQVAGTVEVANGTYADSLHDAEMKAEDVGRSMIRGSKFYIRGDEGRGMHKSIVYVLPPTPSLQLFSTAVGPIGPSISAMFTQLEKMENEITNMNKPEEDTVVRGIQRGLEAMATEYLNTRKGERHEHFYVLPSYIYLNALGFEGKVDIYDIKSMTEWPDGEAANQMASDELKQANRRHYAQKLREFGSIQGVTITHSKARQALSFQQTLQRYLVDMPSVGKYHELYANRNKQWPKLSAGEPERKNATQIALEAKHATKRK